MRIYLDHHASTPLHPVARDAMMQWMQSNTSGNASSAHREGRRQRAVIEHARRQLAAVTGASPHEITFTSGGTEAVHLAVHGVGEAVGVNTVVCDPLGHPALIRSCASLARKRGAGNETLPVHFLLERTGEGLRAYLEALQPPVLIALSWVQHETGLIAPLRLITETAHALGIKVVVDAVQALGKISVDLPTQGVHAAAMSAHKIGGPAGIGALWLQSGVGLRAVLDGGMQERGMRPGSENILGIVGFGAASTLVPSRLNAMLAVGTRRDRLERVLRGVSNVVSNVEGLPRVATVSHTSVRGVAGDELVAALDLDGIDAAAGPACTSGRVSASPAVLAMHPSEPWRAQSCLRLSLSPETTDDEIERVSSVLPRVIAQVRGEDQRGSSPATSRA